MTSVRPKLKPDTPKMLTAWDTKTGRTVYWSGEGNWSDNIKDGLVLKGEVGDAAMAFASGQEAIIFDPYFMEVTEEGGVTGRETIRENIRVHGPSYRKDLGRQAGNN